MIGIEIDLVVKEAKKALALYQSIFDIDVFEETDLEPGLNEVIFTMYGGRFHLLDENAEYQLTAPSPGVTPAFWVNIMLDDIEDVYAKAAAAGCETISPLSTLENMGIVNAVLKDPFGHIWMLHGLIDGKTG